MDKKLGNILIVDDDEDILLAAKMLLKRHAQKVIIEKNPKKIPFLLNHDSYDVILLDMNFVEDTTTGKEGIFWLKEIIQRDPQAVVIMITAYGGVELAVEALKEGATDFVLKPWQNEKLIATISAAAQLNSSRKEVTTLKQAKQTLVRDLEQPFGDMLGESAGMRNVKAIIQKVAKTDANVLILGENGTGKELVARALHKQSSRASKDFIGVDMGAIAETLFESELFGHKKGAFTDAKEDRIGRFEIANKGSLFLDEIGNLPLNLQAKLLAVLQNREVIPLGASRAVPIDIRLICATNMPIDDMIAQKEFRQDLLYRINTVEVYLPPLRERGEDIPLLARHFLQSYAKKYKRPEKKLSAAALTRLQQYHWPGNVRELQHAIERTVIMSDEALIQPDDFFFLSQKQSTEGDQLNTLNLDEMEKTVIEKALQKYNGNISKAARELGLTRASLYRRLEKYGI
ncbi:sigma-54-dependent transcriptional regulator [Microscilla marina]|uniref:Sigma-54 dependent DNA-binding response regulator, Fis family n=1 Tax=Microscilla marina ATCC 23134 TaxID=313606 RepID=A1ZYD6_MICM2|nr:sigma-54 dependent transcriptional regulator [Microscilla marina]EAY24609.1 sigma-54 dependent DNA-binding response regulator, Fis family [Microscilla marina ATCC 23134]